MPSFPNVSPIVVASHPRSGTHLVIDLLRRHFPKCQIHKAWGERLDRLYCNVDELMNEGSSFTESEALRILSTTEAPIVKTHSFPSFESGFFEDHAQALPSDWIEWLKRRASFLYVHRHPCDVMTSYHQFRASYDETSRISLSGFIRAEHDGASRLERWANHVREWIEQPEVLVLRFSDIIHSTDSVLSDVESHLRIPSSRKEPLLPSPFSSIWESRFARLFQTFPESTAIINSESEETSSFSPEDLAYMRKTCDELLNQLNYNDI